jgi:hypothetical protein
MFEVEEEFKITVPPVGAMQSRIQTLGDLVAYVDQLIEQRPAGAAGEAATETVAITGAMSSRCWASARHLAALAAGRSGIVRLLRR